MGEGHAGDEEEGRHEAPCHEGSGTSSHEGHAGDEEEGRHEAPCHEGSSTSSHEGHEGDEEEGRHEAPCHEGSIPASLGRLRLLEILRLSGNYLTGQIPDIF